MTNSSIKDKLFSKKIGGLAASAGVLLFWLAVWEILSLLVGKELLLPLPIDVLRRLFALAGTGEFWLASLLSLTRIMLGFLAGVVGGTLLGALCYRFSAVKRLLSPILVLVRATPVASFIILALVWLSSARVPSFAAFLIVFPLMCGNVDTALSETDKSLLETARFYKLSRLKIIRMVYIPSALPYFVSSATMSLGMSWKAGVAAEVLCTPVGSIGKKLFESKLYLETTDVFAWTAVVIILSIFLEKLVKRLFGRLLPKKRERTGTL